MQVNFLRSFQNVIDFVAISPDYVELVFLIFDPVRREGLGVMDLMFILRMLRLCRIFRLIRHVPGLWILLYTLKVFDLVVSLSLSLFLYLSLSLSLSLSAFPFMIHVYTEDVTVMQDIQTHQTCAWSLDSTVYTEGMEAFYIPKVSS